MNYSTEILPINEEYQPFLEVTSKKIETKINNYFESSPVYNNDIGLNILGNRKDSLLNEKWEKTIVISGRVIKVENDFVHCDCLISKENSLIEVRSFPKLLFGNVYPLKEGAPIKIKISIKAGSSRTDIHDGRGFGIEKEFEVFDIWTELKDFDNNPAF